jgi:hypothetical protein
MNIQVSPTGLSKQESRSAKACLVGSGIGPLAAAAFMIRDNAMTGSNITICEAMPVLGGSLDGGGNAKDGYTMRGGRLLKTDTIRPDACGLIRSWCLWLPCREATRRRVLPGESAWWRVLNNIGINFRRKHPQADAAAISRPLDGLTPPRSVLRPRSVGLVRHRRAHTRRHSLMRGPGSLPEA